MATQNWPYTNLHDLNLDWILEQIKSFKNQLNDFSLHFPHISTHNNGIWDPQYSYEPNEIVYTSTALYISLTYVPTNTTINNTNYWLLIAYIPEDVYNLQERVSNVETEIYYSTPETYGAVGDAVHDDTAAIQAAINNAGLKPVKLSRKYKISSPLHVYTDCTREIDFSGGLITTSDNMEALIIAGEHKNEGGWRFGEKLTIKNGMLNTESKANNGIIIKSALLRCLCDNLTILNVAGSGIKAERAAEGSENTRKYQFNNIWIAGANVPHGDLVNTIGIEVLCWDCIFSNIATFYVHTGIYSPGGAIITNHHHWVPISGYSTPELYNTSCAIHSLNSVQVSNLYDDSGISILTTGGAVIASNIKKESNTNAYTSAGYVLRMIQSINAGSAIKLNGYSWTGSTTNNVKCITIDDPFATATISEIQASGIPLTGEIVDRANNLCAFPGVSAPLWTNSAASTAWSPDKYYLIGYVNNIGNAWSRYQGSIMKADIKIDFAFAKQGSSINDKSNNTELLGQLVFGQPETINNINVCPVYIKPSNNAFGTGTSYRYMSLQITASNGIAGWYPRRATSANEYQGIDTVNSIGSVTI